MQQGSAGPDAVKGVCVIQFIKPHIAGFASRTLPGMLTEFRAPVHGQHPVSVLREVQRSASGSAAQVHDISAGGNQLQERIVMR